MRLPRFRLRLRTQLAVIAILAVLFSFGGNATRRWDFCWKRQAMFARIEQQCLVTASRPNNRVEHAKQAAEDYGTRKWRYRWAVLYFWEPAELIESQEYNY